MAYFIKTIVDWKIRKFDDIAEFITNSKDWIYSVEIKKFWDRTDAQNRYLRWVVYKSISEQTGVSPIEIHYYLKHKILWIDWNNFPSTKSLNVEEFTQYVENVKNEVAELWYYVPEA